MGATRARLLDGRGVLGLLNERPRRWRPIASIGGRLRPAQGLAAHRAIEYAVARTIFDTSARWSRFTVAAVSVVLW